MNNNFLFPIEKTLSNLQSIEIIDKYSVRFDAVIKIYNKLAHKFSDKQFINSNHVYQDADEIYIWFKEYILKHNQLPTDLTKRKLRSITSSVHLLTDTIVANYLLQHLNEQLKKNNYVDQNLLYRLIRQYFNRYNIIDIDLRNTLRKFCWQTLDHLVRTNCRIRLSLQKIRMIKSIAFAVNPANAIIDHYINSSHSAGKCAGVVLEQLAEIFKIANGGNMHENCLQLLIPHLLQEFIQSKPFIIQYLLNNETIEIKQLSNQFLSSIISEIIYLIEEKFSDSEKEWCMKTILNLKNCNNSLKFGDPISQSNYYSWEYIQLYKSSRLLNAKDAKTIFLSWQYGKYIDFFFKTLFSDRNTAKERKTFWSKYTSSLQSVKFFISIKDQTKFKEELLPAKRDWGLTYGTLDTDSQNGGSIFVMEFSEFYIVEATSHNLLAIKICAKDSLKVKDIKTKNSIALKTSSGSLKCMKDNVEEIKTDFDAEYYTINHYPNLSISHQKDSWRKWVKLFLSNHGIQQK